MTAKIPYQPIFCQFINKIETGFLLLDETIQAKVVAFVQAQQHKNGAFTNRSGNPDLYYSLFGAWLTKALKLEQEQHLLKEYIVSNQQVELKIVDKFSQLLIQLVLEVKNIKKPNVFELLRWIKKDGKHLNSAYRFFLFMLSFDALFGKKRWVYFMANIFLNFYHFSQDLPCSFSASLLLIRYLSGKNVDKETANLYQYFENGKGFKSFYDSKNADLLSTAVALFALEMVKADLRIVTPDCLNIVQENFDDGAFLSGDGDLSRDLEYTFYGLLTLGVLS